MSYPVIQQVAATIALTSALLCIGCATTTSGAWYHQSDDDVDRLYFAFVYTGRKDNLTHVTINNKEFEGWDCRIDRNGAEDKNRMNAPQISRGQLVVLWLPRPKEWECKIVVPMEANLHLEGTNTRGRDVKVNVSTSLPSALPESWLHCEPEADAIQLSSVADAENPESESVPVTERNNDELEHASPEKAHREGKYPENKSNRQASLLFCEGRLVEKSESPAR